MLYPRGIPVEHRQVGIGCRADVGLETLLDNYKAGADGNSWAVDTMKWGCHNSSRRATLESLSVFRQHESDPRRTPRNPHRLTALNRDPLTSGPSCTHSGGSSWRRGVTLVRSLHNLSSAGSLHALQHRARQLSAALYSRGCQSAQSSRITWRISSMRSAGCMASLVF